MTGGLLERIGPQTLRILALVLVLVTVIAFFASQIDNYLTGRMFNRLSSSVAIMALIATGQTLVILTRNIDLSVGSSVGLTAFLTGSLVSAVPNLHPALLVAFAIGCGAVLGMINGVLVAYARIPAIIVTLATLALFRSALVEIAAGTSISVAELPAWLISFPNTRLFTIGDLQLRAGFASAFAVVVAVHIMMARLRVMRRFYAVGSNPEAAGSAGINVKSTVLLAFVLGGALAGMAGFMFLARFGNITVVAGLGFELKSVAAAVLGGVAIFGGSGLVLGAFIGALLVDVIDLSLIRWELISEFWREAVLGALILLAVSTDAILMRRLNRLRGRRKALARNPDSGDAS